MKRTGMWILTAAFLGLAVAVHLPASAEDGGAMVASHPMIGEAAPAFSLMDQDHRMTTLEEFRGKKNVVLVFYPRDNTPGCTRQLCSIRDDSDRFDEKDTVVFGINPQGSASHQRI